MGNSSGSVPGRKVIVSLKLTSNVRPVTARSLKFETTKSKKRKKKAKKYEKILIIPVGTVPYGIFDFF